MTGGPRSKTVVFLRLPIDRVCLLPEMMRMGIGQRPTSFLTADFVDNAATVCGVDR